MSLPNRTESIVNGSFAFTSVVVSSESDFSDLSTLLSPDVVDPEIINLNEPAEPQQLPNPQLSEHVDANSSKIYRLDQREESLTPNLDVLRQNVFASVKSNLVDVSIDVAKINRDRQLFQTFREFESHLPIVVSQYAEFPDLPAYDSDLQDATADPVDFNDVYQSIEIHPPEKNSQKPNFLSRQHDPVSVSSNIKTGSTDSSINYQVDHQIDNSRPLETDASQNVSANPDQSIKHDFASAINPAWEVKEFRWSEITTKLIRDYKNAFSKLVHSLKLNGEHSSARIAIVNTRSGQGATTLASCLSTILSDTSARTMLIDLDFENPSIESAANIKIENGWQKILDGTSINELLVRSQTNQLTLMPLKRTEHLVEFRNDIADQLKPLSEALEKHLEFLVYDAGSYAQLLSLPCGASFWDAIVVVSDSKVKESTSDAVLAYEKLLQAGAKSVVIAENFRQ